MVVVEEGMTGPEVSLLAICAGDRIARFPAARDYKPIGDGNTGPNTGGMDPSHRSPTCPDAEADRLIDGVHRPVVAEMSRRGIPFSGQKKLVLAANAIGNRFFQAVREKIYAAVERLFGDGLQPLGQFTVQVEGGCQIIRRRVF